MHEQFHVDVEERGIFKARVSYWLNAIRFINRHTLKRDANPDYQSSTYFPMLRNYILVTLRSLRKNLVFSTINIAGLAIGLASCIIIFFYVQKELSFDEFHTKKDNIYRVTNTYERASGTIRWARNPPALAPAIRTGISGVEQVTRLRGTDDHTYSIGEQVFVERNGFFADSLFLEMFDFELISGDRNTALDLPGSIVITQEMAQKYFGSEDPMGKSILFDNSQSLQVTGVLENIPSNSHIMFDLLISFSTYVVPDGYLEDITSWKWAGFWTYVQLSPSADPALIESYIRELYNQDSRATNRSILIELLPLPDIYLGSEKYSRMGTLMRIGSPSTIYILITIAALVLLLAGFNFMNLSTAISLYRSKEIGVRKVMGAVKSKVAAQFLTESVLIALISLVFSLALIWAVEPYFTSILDIELPSTLAHYLGFLPVFIAAAIVFGFFAGSYPSLLLSRFNPVQALRGSPTSGTSNKWLTKSLMVIQFAVSIGLITISVIIIAQLNFVQGKDLGFDQENVLKVRITNEDMLRHSEALRNRFLQNSRVLEIAQASHEFDGSASSGPAVIIGEDQDNAKQLAYYQTGYNFLNLMDIELLEGRFFSREFSTDPEAALVLNESAVASLGLEEPLGTRIRFNDRDRVVIGVIKDFNFASLHSPIAPMAIVMPFTVQDLLLVKVAPGPVSELLSSLRTSWEDVLGPAPFDVEFLDEGIQQMYVKEQKLSNLIYVFSILTIILGCLGLYGLVAFTIHTKLKEVGVRKVLGASVQQIFFGLSLQFLVLILVANVIAWPITYYFGNLWLESFAYRIDIEWWMFAISGSALLIIAILTISNQTIKAALINPVKILKAE